MRETLPWGGHLLYAWLIAPAHLRAFKQVIPRLPDGQHNFLDLGCGPGHLAAAVAAARPESRMVGIDMDPAQVRLADRRARRHPNLEFHQAPAEDLPFPDDTFAFAMATETFHHWRHPRRVLAEVHRVLAPDGVLCVVEGRAGMEKQEFKASLDPPPVPGLYTLTRLAFQSHGYDAAGIDGVVRPLFYGSPFRDCEVEDHGAFWHIVAEK